MTAFSNHTSTSVKKATKHFGTIKIYGGPDITLLKLQSYLAIN
jgi:hypothetical protein